MAQTRPQAFDRERERRQANVDNAIASLRLEGLQPTDAAVAIFARYIVGELSAGEMSSEVRASNAREFGPVPVSGD